ncbi:MAG: hypothetical protein LBS82_03670 [Spirochaetaceae bacterium]|jgi:hypothetical protein|nr:hypothetical protein [Spirochaetaceae bacterium]
MKRTIHGAVEAINFYIRFGRLRRYNPLVAGFISLFVVAALTGCPDSAGPRPAPALEAVGSGNWEDLDGLSGASVLRMPDRRTFVYAGGGDFQKSYTLKAVDVANPTETKHSERIGYNAAVMQVNNVEGTIAVIAGNRNDEDSEYVDVKLQIYNSSLTKLKEFDFGDTSAATQAKKGANGQYQFTTLFDETRGASLAIGDKYAAIIWLDDNDTWTVQGGRGATKQAYVGIYNIATGASKHFQMLTPTGGAAPGNALATSGIGSPSSLATRGNYLIVGGAVGSAAFSIADDLSLTRVVANDNKPSHWMRDNGSYVMDSAIATVKAWKWNGASAPTCKVIDGMGEGAAQNRGYLRIWSTDPDDPKTAYSYSKNMTTGNGVYKLDLDAGTKTFLFSPSYPDRDNGGDYYTPSPWGIDVFKKGSDTWFILAGGASGTNLATVVALRNPSTKGETIKVTPDWSLALGESVHIVKALTSNGKFFMVARDDTEDSGEDPQLYLHEFE